MVIPWKITLLTYLIYSFIYLFMSYPWWFQTGACPAYHSVYSRATSHQLTANSQEGTRLFYMNFHVPKVTRVIGVKKATPLLPRTSHTAVLTGHGSAGLWLGLCSLYSDLSRSLDNTQVPLVPRLVVPFPSWGSPSFCSGTLNHFYGKQALVPFCHIEIGWQKKKHPKQLL